MKRTKNLPRSLQQMLGRIPYVTIATVCSDGRQPWNTPVVGRFDKQMNLYWVSWRNSQHSKNIAINSRIFVVVYDSQAPEGSGEGLYLSMDAQALDDQDDINQAKATYNTDFFEHDSSHDQFLGECPQRMYKATPQKAWINAGATLQGHYIDIRRACGATAR